MKAYLNSFKTVGHTLDLTKERRSYDRLKFSSAAACAVARTLTLGAPPSDLQFGFCLKKGMLCGRTLTFGAPAQPLFLEKKTRHFFIN